jgi:hypothetical protein
MAFSYRHVNVINIVGTTTIIINIRGILIKTHVMFTKNGRFLWLEFFFRRPKKIMIKEILIG